MVATLNPIGPHGILRAPPALVSITVPNASTVAYILTTGRSFFLRRVTWTNRNAAAGVLRLGYTDPVLGWTQVFPDIPILPGLSNVEDSFPPARFGYSLIARSSVAAVAPNDVQILPTVEEFDRS